MPEPDAELDEGAGALGALIVLDAGAGAEAEAASARRARSDLSDLTSSWMALSDVDWASLCFSNIWGRRT